MSRARLAEILPHKAQNGTNDLVVKCINACQLQDRPEPWTKTASFQVRRLKLSI